MDIIFHTAGTIILLGLIVWICVVFTNAVEHLGKILNLGHGAVGSVFAAVGTALPETIVPLVAILGAYFVGGDTHAGKEIGVGAILGAPFLLSTLAMFLVGLSALVFHKLKLRKNSKITADYHHVTRDFKYFYVSYGLAILAGFLHIHIPVLKYLIAIFLLCYYGFYVYKTILHSKDESDEDEELEPLMICKLFKKMPCGFWVGVQIVFSLTLLVVFAHLFVEEIKYFSQVFNINPLILSLIIAPIATELPEKANSVIWIRHDKDTLALGNITGAMVFQSAIPPAIGILLTPWTFDSYSIANIITVFAATIFISITSVFNKELKPWALICCGLFYLGFISYIILHMTGRI